MKILITVFNKFLIYWTMTIWIKDNCSGHAFLYFLYLSAWQCCGTVVEKFVISVRMIVTVSSEIIDDIPRGAILTGT